MTNKIGRILLILVVIAKDSQTTPPKHQTPHPQYNQEIYKPNIRQNPPIPYNQNHFILTRSPVLDNDIENRYSVEYRSRCWAEFMQL